MQSNRSSWHDSAQWASCAQEESSAIGSALLLGEWWEAAQLLQTARTEHTSRTSWTAWLRGIPISESHACRLVKIAEAGLATSTQSYRHAYAATRQKRRWEKGADPA